LLRPAAKVPRFEIFLLSVGPGCEVAHTQPHTRAGRASPGAEPERARPWQRDFMLPLRRVWPHLRACL